MILKQRNKTGSGRKGPSITRKVQEENAAKRYARCLLELSGSSISALAPDEINTWRRVILTSPKLGGWQSITGEKFQYGAMNCYFPAHQCLLHTAS